MTSPWPVNLEVADLTSTSGGLEVTPQPSNNEATHPSQTPSSTSIQDIHGLEICMTDLLASDHILEGQGQGHLPGHSEVNPRPSTSGRSHVKTEV